MKLFADQKQKHFKQELGDDKQMITAMIVTITFALIPVLLIWGFIEGIKAMKESLIA